MGVSIVSQYRIHDGGRDAFIQAVKESNALATSLGGRPVLRQTTMGGELTGVHAWIVQFANGVARGALLDEITKPENVARNALVHLQRAGGATLLGRVFLNEIPASEDLASMSQVLAVGRYRIVAGHFAAAEAALAEAKAIRKEMGVEAHVYNTVNGGQNTNVRILSTHAGSYREQAEIADRLAERNQGRGPIPLAIEAGALIAVGNSLSALVAV